MTAEPPSTDSVRPQPLDDIHSRFHTSLRVCLSNLKSLWLLAKPDQPQGANWSEEQARKIIDGKMGALNVDLWTRLDFLSATEGADEWRQLDAWRFLWAVVERIRAHFGPKIPWPTTWGRVRAELLNWQPPPDFDRLAREADANLKRRRREETPPRPPAAAPITQSAMRGESLTMIDPSIQAILEQAREARAAAAEAQRVQEAAMARFDRVKSAWESLQVFRGELTPKTIAESDCLQQYARRIIDLGETLEADGWRARVDAASPGAEAKTYALEILRRAMDGDFQTVTVLIQEAVTAHGLLWFETNGWLREGLRNEILNVQLPPEPPQGWEGPYLQAVQTVEDFLTWFEEEFFVRRVVNRGGRDKQSDGQSLRNAYRLVDKLGLVDIPPQPIGRLTYHEEEALLRNLQRECRRRLMESERREGAEERAEPPPTDAPAVCPEGGEADQDHQRGDREEAPVALAAGDGSDQRWLTVSEAARIAGCNTWAITRAVNAGELKGNGSTGRRRRVDAVDLARWQLARANRLEPAESTEAVEKLVKKHVCD